MTWNVIRVRSKDAQKHLAQTPLIQILDSYWLIVIQAWHWEFVF